MSQPPLAAPVDGYEARERITPAHIAGLAEEAADRINGFVSETPLAESPFLGNESAQVFVKDETGQPGGSFKDRGAGNAVMYHTAEGIGFVATSSAGNHGLGLARAAQQQGVDSLVVLPGSTSEERKQAVSSAGAEIILHGKNFDEALGKGLAVAEERGGRFVHPFADPLVMAGQGTIGLELLRQAPDMTHVVIPVGGGGLLAGVASVIKEHREGVKVIAAQTPRNTAYVDSLEQGRPLRDQSVDTFYRGLAVGNVDPATFDIARELVDGTIVLDELDSSRAMFDYRAERGTLLEPAGAVSPAAARKLAGGLAAAQSAEIVAIATGANNPRRFSKWMDARARRYGWNNEQAARY